MSTAATPRPATFDDLRAIPEAERFHEVIHGEVVRKAAPSGPHGRAQRKTGACLDPYDRPAGSGGGPGGWWLASEVEVELAPHEVYRPDVVGWRRERLPDLPRASPVRSRPDWVCEVVSPSHPGRDRVVKLRAYREYGVPHYWLLDPDSGTLLVHRLVADGCLVALAAERGERVRAEPFDAIEIAIDALLGDAPA